MTAPAAGQAFPVEVPAGPYTGLQPVRILSDQSHFSHHTEPGVNQPFPHSVSVAGSSLWVATGRGVQRWSIANPAVPQRESYGYAPSALPVFHHSDLDWHLEFAEAAPDDSLALVAGKDQGVSVWSRACQVHYQDEGVRAAQVAITTAADGRWLGWVLGDGQLGRAIYCYDLLAASALNGALDASPLHIGAPGIYLGPQIPGSFLGLAATGHHLVTAGFQGVAVYRADSTMPVQVATMPLQAKGVACWTKQKPSGVEILFVAVVTSTQLLILRLKPGGVLQVFSQQESPVGRNLLRASRSPEGRVYLSACSWPQSVEDSLYDVTKAKRPRALGTGGYLRHYVVPGYRWVMPRGWAAGPQGILYRAAFGLLDAHRIVGPAGLAADEEGED